MTDTPKKTLTISRKPTSGGAGTSAPGQVTRSGKRIIRREELPGINKPSTKQNPHSAKAGKGKDPKKKPARKPAIKKPVISPSELKARELSAGRGTLPPGRQRGRRHNPATAATRSGNTGKAPSR